MKKSTILTIIYFILAFLFSLWFTSCNTIKKTETSNIAKETVTDKKVNSFIDTTKSENKETKIVEVQYFKDTVKNKIVTYTAYDTITKNYIPTNNIKSIKVTTISLVKSQQGKTVIDSVTTKHETAKTDTVIKSDIKPINGFKWITWIFVLLTVISIVIAYVATKYSKINLLDWIKNVFKK